MADKKVKFNLAIAGYRSGQIVNYETMPPGHRFWVDNKDILGNTRICELVVKKEKTAAASTKTEPEIAPETVTEAAVEPPPEIKTEAAVEEIKPDDEKETATIVKPVPKPKRKKRKLAKPKKKLIGKQGRPKGSGKVKKDEKTTIL